MCLQCDGYSFEQSMLSLDLTIRTYGWQLTQVTDVDPWSYTIGLLELAGVAHRADCVERDCGWGSGRAGLLAVEHCHA